MRSVNPYDMIHCNITMCTTVSGFDFPSIQLVALFFPSIFCPLCSSDGCRRARFLFLFDLNLTIHLSFALLCAQDATRLPCPIVSCLKPPFPEKISLSAPIFLLKTWVRQQGWSDVKSEPLEWDNSTWVRRRGEKLMLICCRNLVEVVRWVGCGLSWRFWTLCVFCRVAFVFVFLLKRWSLFPSRDQAASSIGDVSSNTPFSPRRIHPIHIFLGQ